MRAVLMILLLASTVLQAGDGWSRRGRGPQPKPNEPWMGVKLGRMDKVTQAHLKDVPKGFGLIVEEIDAGSPAEEAGLEELDILWKFDDQLVANQQQLYCLLLHKGLDSEVKVTVSRRGAQTELAIVLKPRPLPEAVNREIANEMISPSLPIPGLARKVVYDRRTAYVQVADETVSLSRTPEGFRYVVSKAGELVEQGRLVGEDPENWNVDLEENLRDSLVALSDSLLNAEERDKEPPRTPRVRRVPNPPTGISSR